MDYLIRFVQMHESFRQAETDAIADLEGLQMQWLHYSADAPFAIIRFTGPTGETTSAARTLIARSILATSIHELWGTGPDYPTLHTSIRALTSAQWPAYQHTSFRFTIDSYHSSRPLASQHTLIESFAYMSFTGPIAMRNPANHFTVFEESRLDAPTPHRLYFGRLVGASGRKQALVKYNLKKRTYIATTSMDAELSLVTANLAQAAAGKLIYDPFMGTGSFPLACAHFGATVFGSDLDGRSIRGQGARSVKANFEQYATASNYLGGFVADLTNTPLRHTRTLDGIICDPPYGVREGLKVLGSTRVALKEVVYLSDGTPAHLGANYIPPKKGYRFERMLDDVLSFAAEGLVEGGRLCMWMPVAGAGEEAEYEIPRHPALRLVSECTQDFNKWSRRLLTYARCADGEVDADALLAYRARRSVLSEAEIGPEVKTTANNLNAFRKRYFEGFRERSAESRCD
ncbi:hypothetical protein BAUCODRAFT_61919 [Baudoinia panamericana UAMH 10762]|uniref:tRNA (guanine(10)-N(2))-methyltransferase n=1 Tax=Baudoinia panamericana (strain UAMH 10762) TaxID=717646 RepID=M2M1W8_BAUPA|nr:uncharacterized protein BAUCODRAFT_61919 [Baudoinia panamericana UAMH 10762]EMD01053.1 hypothetical protein BAUCODRAFT_61919 [Baudoinia panamericana UAMH 10762]